MAAWASRFGIRVFELRATEGPTHRVPLDLVRPFGEGSAAVLEQLERLGQRLCERTEPLSTIPRLHDPEWVEPSDPGERDTQIYFEECARLPDGSLFVALEHGYLGEYAAARGRAGRSVDISDLSPVRTYRALFVAPTAGTEGRLVVETIGGRCPVTGLVNWLGWAGRENATGTGDRWLRVKAYQIADREHLRKMIANAAKVETELVERQPGKPGSRRPVKSRLIQDTSQQRASLLESAMSILNNEKDADFVTKVTRISGYDPAKLEEAGLHLDDASIVIHDAAGGTPKKINPELIREKFTYPLPAVRLEKDAWVQAAVDRLRGTLIEGTDIQL